jgi:hypothetical protein
VADPVREEDGHRAVFDPAVNVAAQQAEVDQTASQDQRGSMVDVAELDAGSAAIRRRNACCTPVCSGGVWPRPVLRGRADRYRRR